MYNLVNKTNLEHNFILYVYFYPLHVSGNYVPIIRRSYRINATSGICHSVWMTVWYAGWDETPSCIPDGHPHNLFYGPLDSASRDGRVSPHPLTSTRRIGYFIAVFLFCPVNKTILAHNFSLYAYFYSLRVLGNYVPIIRRNYRINATPGIFHSVWMTVWCAGWDFIPSCIPDGHPHRVKSTRCRIDTVISPDDGHIVAQNT